VEIAEVDALDQRSVELYANAVVAKADSLDISFNAIGLGDVQGAPLVEMSYEYFALAIITAMKTHFFTATTAARHMAKKGTGVIMAITAQTGRKPYRDVGGIRDCM
jgi:3-oxoacyl-[acyl-carrier protein] reductase